MLRLFKKKSKKNSEQELKTIDKKDEIIAPPAPAITTTTTNTHPDVASSTVTTTVVTTAINSPLVPKRKRRKHHDSKPAETIGELPTLPPTPPPIETPHIIEPSVAPLPVIKEEDVLAYYYYNFIWTGECYKEVPEFFVPSCNRYFNEREIGISDKPRNDLNSDKTGIIAAITAKKIPAEIVKELKFDQLPLSAKQLVSGFVQPSMRSDSLSSSVSCVHEPINLNNFTATLQRRGNDVLKVAIEGYVIDGGLPENISLIKLKDYVYDLDPLEKETLLNSVDVEVMQTGKVQQIEGSNVPLLLAIPAGIAGVALAAFFPKVIEDNPKIGAVAAVGVTLFGFNAYRNTQQSAVAIEERKNRAQEFFDIKKMTYPQFRKA